MRVSVMLLSLLFCGILPAQVGEWGSSALGPGEEVTLGGTRLPQDTPTATWEHGQLKAAFLETLSHGLCVCLGVVMPSFRRRSH